MKHLDISSIYDDAKTYDLIHVPEKRNDEAFYRSLAKPHSDVLELACGTGRLTIPLAQSGLEMAGLDLSESMLAEGRKKAEILGVEIQWHHGDARNFNLNKKFSLIFMPCNSLQHIHRSDDVLLLFDRVKTHLSPKGIFAFDIFRPNLTILNRDPDKLFHVLKYKGANGEEVSLDERTRYDDVSQVANIEWFHHDPDGMLLKHDVLQMRQFFPQEVEQLLQSAGFRIIEKFGNWMKEPMSSANFKQIIVVETETV